MIRRGEQSEAVGLVQVVVAVGLFSKGTRRGGNLDFINSILNAVGKMVSS